VNLMKRLSAVFIVILLVLSGTILFFQLDEKGFASADVSGNKSGTWNAGTYYMVGDVTVPSGQTLTLMPGVNIFVNGDYSFIVEGTLFADGSTGSFITFDSNQTVKAPGDWKGIQFKGGSKGSITNCKISYADIGLNISSSTPNLALIEIHNSNTADVMVAAADVIINSSMIQESKVSIEDGSSSLDVRYSVNVHASNVTAAIPLDLKDITVDVSSALGPVDVKLTDMTGWVHFINCSAYVKTQAKTDYTMQSHTVQVNDSFDGTPLAYPGISKNSTMLNISSYSKVTSIGGYIQQIELFFTFIYPPVIDNYPGASSSDTIAISEDNSQSFAFEYHDNDHPTASLTVSITNSTNTDLLAQGWVTHSLANKALTFYCTNEDWGNDVINISVTDGTGLFDFKVITMTYTTVNDAPVINLSSKYSAIFVDQDEEIYIPIEIYDEDDAFDTLSIDISSPYVTLMPNGTLKFLYPNEFGSDGAKDKVFINVSDSVNPVASVSILVTFKQLNDPVQIDSTIPDQEVLETDVTWNLDLSIYRADSDPDEVFQWWVTGLNSNHLSVTGENTSSEILNFQIIGDDIGGATPSTLTDDITIWVKDSGNAMDSQALKIKITSVNTAPALSSRVLTPATGDTTTPFNFQVKYKDLDGSMGDTPTFVRIVIDGTEYDMAKLNATDMDFTEGVTYTYTTYLSSGTHDYYFTCSDGAENGRLPHTEPDTFTTPEIASRIYIKTFWSSDNRVSAKLAFYGEEGTATITTGLTPTESLKSTLGDIGLYFEITTTNIVSISWGLITVYYSTLKTALVNNATISIYYYSTIDGWVDLMATGEVDQFTKINTTDAGSLILVSPAVMFTAAGDLDADGDGYLNEADKFPYDKAAKTDSDDDGHPDSWNYPDSSDPTKSSIPTTLDYDEFPNDPTEWDDADGDGYGDNIDEFDDNPAAWRDSDGDGMPDELNQRADNPTNLREDTDDDNDGMADWWEEKYGFDPLDPSDADGDADGDGYSNLEEYQEETDPTDKDDFPDEDGLLTEDLFMYLIIIIVVVVVLVVVAVVMVKRKKPEEEEAPEEEGAAAPPEPETEAQPPTEPPAPAPPDQLPQPPAEPPAPPTEMPPPPPAPEPAPAEPAEPAPEDEALDEDEELTEDEEEEMDELEE
jgi:hypothetical protein